MPVNRLGGEEKKRRQPVDIPTTQGNNSGTQSIYRCRRSAQHTKVTLVSVSLRSSGVETEYVPISREDIESTGQDL